MSYRITAADRGLIVTALRALGGADADALADRMVEAAAPKSAKPMPAEPFVPATGDAELDAFLVAHHHDDWQARNARAFADRRPGMIPFPKAPKPRPYEVGSGRATLSRDERSVLWATYGVRETRVAS
jgi:hypothetical protein